MVPLPSVRPIAALLALSVLLTGCSMFGGNRARKTPLPIPTLVASATPNKQLKLDTFKPPKCSAKVAFNLLIDTSSSMAKDFYFDASGNPIITPNSRLPNFKRAALSFGEFLGDDDVIGIQEFNGTPFDPGTEGPNARVVLPLNTWINNQASYNRAVSSLYARGSTHMKDGFQLANQEITKVQNKYSDYTWVLVFMSDGVPKDKLVLSDDPQSSLPDETQNPTKDPNIVQTVKDNGVRIVTVGVELDKLLPSSNVAYGKNLMRTIASSQADYYEAVNSNELEGIYQKIAEKACGTTR